VRVTPAITKSDFNFRSDAVIDTFEKAKCRGVSPDVFEVNPRAKGAVLAAQTWIALSTCSTCPLRGLQGACTKWVDPEGSQNNIVAGGWVWIMGKPVLSWYGETHDDTPQIEETRANIERLEESLAS
jgi:hypothetical protein